MNWLKPWNYTPPDPTKTTMADFMLGSAVLRDLLNADMNFLDGQMGPQYASPRAYLLAMVNYAQSLTQNTFAKPYAPPSWDPIGAALDATMACFNMLSQLPVNIGDPNTVSVMQAWVTAKGGLYGGHDPLPAVAAPTSAGTNPATGPSSVPPGILGGTGPQQ